KFQLFASAFALGAGEDGRLYQALAVIAVLNAAAGAYYYLKIVVGMYLRQPEGEPLAPRFAGPTAVAVTTCVLLTVFVGLFPAFVARASRDAAAAAVARPEPAEMAGGVATISGHGSR